MTVEHHPSTPSLPPIVVPSDPIWRLTVDQYHEMIRTGILTEDDPVELLEGWLVAKMPKKPRHTLATELTREAFVGILPSGWFTNAQEPITTDDSEPEPDVTVARGERRDYLDRHPGPNDIALIVEVSDTTLQRDRSLKKRVYARAGIPVYWIVNLVETRIEAYAAPSGPTEEPDYLECREYAAGDEIPVLLDGNEIGRLAVGELFP